MLCGLVHDKRQCKYRCKDAESRTQRRTVIFYTQAKLPKVGELQREGDREETETKIIGIEKIREVRLEVVTEEEIGVMTGVVNLQKMRREISRLKFRK